MQVGSGVGCVVLCCVVLCSVVLCVSFVFGFLDFFILFGIWCRLRCS